MSETLDHPGIDYTQLENGIHQFVFYDSAKGTVDTFFERLEIILATTPHTEIARYILDVSQGSREISLVGMTQRFRRLETQFAHRARGRTAVLHKPGAIMAFFDNFVRTLAPSRDMTRFFSVEKRQEAIAWLLREES